MSINAATVLQYSTGSENPPQLVRSYLADSTMLHDLIPGMAPLRWIVRILGTVLVIWRKKVWNKLQYSLNFFNVQYCIKKIIVKTL